MSARIRPPERAFHRAWRPPEHLPQRFETQSLDGSFASHVSKPSTSRTKLGSPLSTRTKLAILGSCIAIFTLAIVVCLSVCLTSNGKCGLANPNGFEAAQWEKQQSLTGSAWTPVDKTRANGLMFQGFEWYMPKDTKHWVRLKNQLGKLEAIGVDNIWIPPPSKNANSSLIGYDVYDLWDLGEFDQKGQVPTGMGLKEELTELAKEAELYGIGLTVDAVLNHRAGADKAIKCNAVEVNKSNRSETTSTVKSIDAWVGFEFAGRHGRYSDKTWSCDDFTAVDYDDATKDNAIYKLQGTHNSFATDVSDEKGNYDYLLLADVAYNNPSVQADVKAWGWWITNMLNVKGFRLDAVKHISRRFMLDFMNNIKMHRNDGLDPFYAAEFWTSNVTLLRDYVRAMEYRVSVFDVPLVLKLASYAIGNLTDMGEILQGSYTADDATYAVTFVSSHDTQLTQALSQYNIGGWFLPLAYALILLRSQGYPTIFYGDMYGTFDSSGRFADPVYAGRIADLAMARKYYAYGDQDDYFDTPSVVGWTRSGTNDRSDGLAVLMSNSESAKHSKRMNVGSKHSGEVWTNLLNGKNAKTTIDGEGWGFFEVDSRSVSVYTNKNAHDRDKFGRWDPSIYGSHG